MGVPVDLPRHPVYVQLVFWGLFPTIYQVIQLGSRSGRRSRISTCRVSMPFHVRGHRPGAQRGRLHGRNRSGRHQFRAGGADGGVDGTRHVLGDDDAPHGAAAGDAGDHPADRQRGDQDAEDHIAGHRGAVHARSLRHHLTGHRRRANFEPIPLLLVAATWYLLFTSILMVGQYYLEKYFARGASRKLTNRQLEALAKAQMTGTQVSDTTHATPMVQAEQVCKSFGALQRPQGHHAEVDRGEVLVLVGPSGSGKSTFLRCINHLERSTPAGSMSTAMLIGYREAGRQAVRDAAREAAKQRRDIGMVFQHFNLFPHRTALENVIEAPVHVKGVKKAEAVARARSAGPVGWRRRRTPIRRSCPAASSSVSRSPARWRWTPS